MKRTILALALSLFLPAPALLASELDHEDQIKNARRHAADLPQTVVVRRSKLDGTVGVYHSRERLSPQAAASPIHYKYIPMKSTDRVKHELDRDSSKSGWYFYWYAYSHYQPAYYYYGHNYYYQPYYTFYRYPYYYSYYCWC